MSGFILVERELFDDPVLKGTRSEPLCRHSAWIWMVAEAAWRETAVPVNGQIITLQRGQFSHSHRFLAKAWGWELGKVQRFIAALIRGRKIESATESGQALITIVNYQQIQRLGFEAVRATESAIGSASSQDRVSSESKKKEGKKGTRESSPTNPETHAGAGEDAGADDATGNAIVREFGAGRTPNAIQIIRAFDAARLAVWGTAQTRQWPSQFDHAIATGFLKEGVEAGIAEPDMVQLCTQLFLAVHQQHAMNSPRPIDDLRYHRKGITRMIEQQKPSLLGELSNVRPIGPAAARERRDYRSADGGGVARRAALAAAAGPGELESGG